MRAGFLCMHESAPNTWYWTSLESITAGAAHPVVSPGAGYPEPLCPFPTDNRGKGELRLICDAFHDERR